MNLRKIVTTALAVVLFVAAGGHLRQAHAGLVIYEIMVDTSGLIAGPGGQVDIQLTSNVSQTSPTVLAQVNQTSTDGTLGSVTSTSGNAMGDLTTPVGVTTDNTESANALQQSFTVASFFDVFVALSGSEIGPGATGSFSGSVFSLSVHDSGSNSAGATLTVNPNVDSDGKPIVDGTVGITTSGPNVQVIPVLSVPEPSGVVLMGLGLAGVVGLVRRRRSRDCVHLR